MTEAERLRAAIEPLLPIDGRTLQIHVESDDDAADEARFWLGAIWCELRAVPKGCVLAVLNLFDAWKPYELGASRKVKINRKTDPLWLREVEAMAELLRRVREREARR